MSLAIQHASLRPLGGDLLLLGLSDGTYRGWACGAVAEPAARAALEAATGRDPAELALRLPSEEEAPDAAAGLVAMAALDLAARRERVPAAVLLGAAPPATVPITPPETTLPRGAVWLPRDAAGLRQALLDPATLLLIADPVAAGGPGEVRRLAAAARAFQVELALAPVPHPAAIAGAAQLRAGRPWLRHRPLYAALPWQPDPAAPGFGWQEEVP